MNKKVLFRGTIFEFALKSDEGQNLLSRYMLVECHEVGYVFQIICLSGYKTGAIYGYIKEDPTLKGTHRGISSDHLLDELRRNFLNILDETVRIFPLE